MDLSKLELNVYESNKDYYNIVLLMRRFSIIIYANSKYI